MIWGLAAVVIVAGLLIALLTMDDDRGFLDKIPFGPARARPATAELSIDDLPLETLVPSDILKLSAEDALARNMALPISRVANPLAPPFVASWLGGDLPKSTVCLAQAVYYEANGEPLVGQRAVAQVVLNRLRHPRYPKTVCDVVFQGSERPTGCQFSFTCDGSLSRTPNAARWATAMGVATAALQGWTSVAAGQATHYHTLYVFPKWAPELLKTGVIGHHVFYRLPGRFYDYSVFRDAVAANPPPPDAAATDAVDLTVDPSLLPGGGVGTGDPVTLAAPPAAPSTGGASPGDAPGGNPAANAGSPPPNATPAPAPSPTNFFPTRRRSRPQLPLAQ